MCELMGLSFDRAMSADFSIRAFALRDVENADGWGLAWYPDRSASVVKEALTWRQSHFSKFLETYKGLKSNIYIAHVRHKTIGGTPTHSDTHPFQRECFGREFCFAHNGTIRGYQTLALSRYHPVGNTDSEHVFCHLLDLLAEHDERLQDESSWRWLHGLLRTVNQSGTLNCLLSDGQRLFAYRDMQGWKGLAFCHNRFRAGESGVLKDATMNVKMVGQEDSNGFLVATSPLSESGWHDFAPGHMAVVENGSMIFSTQGIAVKAS